MGERARLPFCGGREDHCVRGICWYSLLLLSMGVSAGEWWVGILWRRGVDG